jgi:predicted NBD/HSP70 family sugar kinase/DNA-binding MarR family transcriptional regulator
MIAHKKNTNTISSTLIRYSAGDKDMSSAEAIRNLNRCQVLDALRCESPITLSDLVDRASLSRATVSSIVSEMRTIGLLERAGWAESTGGRRPTLLSFNPAARMAVGVTMFDNEIKAVLTDLNGTPCEYFTASWDGQQVEDLVLKMIETVKNLCSSIDCNLILGVGVGLPGVVDVNSGTIIEYVTPSGRIDAPIEAGKQIQKALQLPTMVTNRSRVAALGELQFGVGQGVPNLLYLFIGRGIVASIVIDGSIYFGPSFTAGEIGHNTVVQDGHLCGCGNHGCLEMYASESAIIARAIAKARATPDSALRDAVNGNLRLLSSDTVIETARDGDPAAIEVLNRTGEYLGIALSSAINMINPEMLILGGPIGCKAGSLLIEPTVREIECRVLSLPLSNLTVVSGSEEIDSAAIGAAVLVLKNSSIDRIFNGIEL